eukprot:TRINITY_DN70197_c0_g1_i1.p1 TRINITY_DN70197_c0_g1~~TRINITY_DN70197_c0_g1_i1.p1  ORF type:complete len:721 (+),score=305.86 TRINITY_DN70197_c0_g1_i1:95-2164(+)
MPIRPSDDRDLVAALHAAWMRDATGRESTTSRPEDLLAFREVVERATEQDGQFQLRSHRLGASCVEVLHRSLGRFHISRVDLRLNILRDSGCEAMAAWIKDSAHLVSVDIGGNDIGPAGACALAEVLPLSKRLQSLLLASHPARGHRNRINSAAAVQLADAARRTRSLHLLDLSGNPIGRESQDAFRILAVAVERSHPLQVLRLADTMLQPDAALELARSLATNSALSELDLSGNDLPASVGTTIAASLAERNQKGQRVALRRLDLTGNARMGDKGAEAVIRSTNLRVPSAQAEHALRAISLRACGVTDRSCFTLAEALTTGSRVQSIDLAANYISAAGCTAIARALVGNQHLQTLCLSRNKIQNLGAVQLAEALEMNEALLELALDECRISDKGAIAIGVGLASNSALATLRLCNNHISDEAGRAFATVLEKNKTMQAAALQGNQIDHSTQQRVAQTLKRNRHLKADQEPARLRREVIWLHYQGLQLEKANEELQQYRVRKQQLADEIEMHEQTFQQERSECSRKIKELNERIAQEQQELEELERRRATRDSESERIQQQCEEEMQRLEKKAQEEQQRKEEEQKKLEARTRELSAAERQRDEQNQRFQQELRRKEQDTQGLKAQIREYQARIESVTEQLQLLEPGDDKERSALGAKKAGKEEKPAKGQKNRKRDELRRSSGLNESTAG